MNRRLTGLSVHISNTSSAGKVQRLSDGVIEAAAGVVLLFWILALCWNV
jgi:hypothetical protein